MKYFREGNLFLPKNIIRGGLGKYIDVGIDLPTVRFGGFFTVELLDRSGRVKRKLEFKNLIINAALDALVTTGFGVMRSYCGVGTGSTAPTNSDASLQAEITPASTNRTNQNGGISITNNYFSGPPDYWEQKTTYLFDFAQGNGNLTEIGLFQLSSAGTMFTRQLLKDSGGIPTTVVKTSSDQLRVTYTFQVYPPTTDVVTTPTISGTVYTLTARARSANTSNNWGGWTSQGPNQIGSGSSWAITSVYSGAIGARTAGPAGTAVDDTSRSIAAYVSGNKYLDCTSIWSAAVANFGAGGIQAIATYCASVNSPSNWAIMQIGVSPAFAKDNTKQLTLVIRNSWDRYP